MKFFQNRTLRYTGAYVLLAMFMILLIQYVFIRWRIEDLEETEEKKDFARSIQLDGQQIANLVQIRLFESKNLSSEIISRLDHQQHNLQILGMGGRIDGTDIFLKPLSRLPQITFDNLVKHHDVYHKNIIDILTDSTPPTSDSVSNIVHHQFTTKTLLPAQWLTISNWFERLLTDLTEISEEKKSFVENLVLTFIILDIVLLVLIYYLFNYYVIRPLQKLKEGTLKHFQDYSFARDEIGQLSTEINEILEQLKDAAEFVGAIGEGKLDSDYKVLDANYELGKNKLADSLIGMQSKLKVMNEEEHRRQWANEGLSRFVDILRLSNDNIQILGDRIISALVQYTGANQGGLYILNDEDENNKYLELVSLFAFNIKKFEKQKIKLGEGILGQTFLEKETTVLKEMPEEFVRITSGLGEANPKSILIVPLKLDKLVYGIVELASFKDFQAHEISFVEKLAETIASTLGSVKAAQKNKHLIEQFQQQTEEMRAQEEEMRQNMEELQATQEEMARKERDYITRINTLEKQNASSEEVSKEIEKLKQELEHKIRQHRTEIEALQNKLSQKPAQTGDWALAEEVEKNLKFQIEALKITQESLKNS
jgi:GAF domain-containing protein/HAMP domain-containing protein